ncbi:N-acetylglucosamine-6-phosphate deacetylase isoform X3 [Ixodes scapularis]|nr:N-acetylglucosamine-6-phosphate deacetylase isoform X3 [Ixodes scapularis]
MGVDFSHNVDIIGEAVAKVAKGVLPFGVTSICPTIVTSTPDVYHKALSKVQKCDGSANGAGILGLHLEGPFINKHKKGAHKAQLIQSLDDGLEAVARMYGPLDNVAIVTVAPELDVEDIVIPSLVKRGITVSIGHSEANLVQGEKAIQRGASFITHLFNAMLPFHHRDPGLVGLLTSKKLPEEKHIFYGIIADGIHTHPAALRIAYKTNARGLTLVTDAMSAMGLEAGVHFIGENKVEIVGKRAVIAGTSTLCGSIATMDFCVRFLQKSTGCSTVEALESASLHPAEVLGIADRKGTLNFGAEADFVMLGSDLHVTSTWIAGKCVWERSPNEFTYERKK